VRGVVADHEVEEEAVEELGDVAGGGCRGAPEQSRARGHIGAPFAFVLFLRADPQRLAEVLLVEAGPFPVTVVAPDQEELVVADEAIGSETLAIGSFRMWVL